MENTNIMESAKLSDNGIGIPDLDQKAFFQPFSRAYNTGNVPGTGLGLNIVPKYVTLMNCKADFVSELNQETKFKLSFNR